MSPEQLRLTARGLQIAATRMMDQAAAAAHLEERARLLLTVASDKERQATRCNDNFGSPNP
jgi:hypothetical protein